MNNEMSFAQKAVLLALAAILAVGVENVFSAPIESPEIASDLPAMAIAMPDMAIGAGVNQAALAGSLNVKISARAMSEDFSQTAPLMALAPESQFLSAPAPVQAAAQYAPEAAASRNGAESSARNSRRARSSELKAINRLVSEMRAESGAARSRDLNRLYLGSQSYADAPIPAQDARRERWEKRRQAALRKNQDWVGVSQNAAAITRILGSHHPKIALELAREGLRSRSDIAAEYTALALGQIASAKALRRYPGQVAELYRVALGRKDRDVRRYAAEYMDRFAKAFWKSRPDLVVAAFRTALRDRDSYVRAYALQNLQGLPAGLTAALARDISRASRAGN